MAYSSWQLRSYLRLATGLAGLSLLLAGCALPADHPWVAHNPLGWMIPKTAPASRPAPAAPVAATPAPRVPTNIVAAAPVNPRVRLFKITLPLGTFSLNEKIWRQLDEDALDSRTSVLLAQNGIRAAVGPQARWPAVAKLLEVPGASTEEFMCQTDGRSTLNIVTRPSVPEQTVFYIDRDLNLQGRTFDRCDNAVRLSMSRPRDSQVTTIQLEPVVQIGTVTVARGGDQMGVVRMTNPVEETFANLRLAADVKPDEFLVLSPSDPKHNSFSVGTRFLSSTEKVPALETILVLVPVSPQSPRK